MATLRATDFAPWTVRGLVASHKVASLVIAALCAFDAGGFFCWWLSAQRPARFSDSTTCAQWGSTNVNGQDAYARLYVKEHFSLRQAGGPAPQGAINAINAGCYQAFGEGVDDQATVVQAISRDF